MIKTILLTEYKFRTHNIKQSSNFYIFETLIIHNVVYLTPKQKGRIR